MVAELSLKKPHLAFNANPLSDRFNDPIFRR